MTTVYREPAPRGEASKPQLWDVAVASDGVVYFAAHDAHRVVSLDSAATSDDHATTTVARVNGPMGLLLDEEAGRLLITCNNSVRAVAVPTLAERRAARPLAMARLWTRVQRERGDLAGADDATLGKLPDGCLFEGLFARVIRTFYP